VILIGINYVQLWYDRLKIEKVSEVGTCTDYHTTGIVPCVPYDYCTLQMDKKAAREMEKREGGRKNKNNFSCSVFETIISGPGSMERGRFKLKCSHDVR